MKSQINRWRNLKGALFHIPAISIALVITAVASLSLTAYITKDFVKVARTAAIVTTETPRGDLIKVVKQPATQAEVSDLVQLLKQNHPSLDISQSAIPGGLSVSASSVAQYREWVTALGTIQGAARAGSIWMATAICVNSCGTGAMRAEVQGIVQKVSKGG